MALKTYEEREFFRCWAVRGDKLGVALTAYGSRVPIQGIMYKVIGCSGKSFARPIQVKNSLGRVIHVPVSQLHIKHQVRT